MRKIIIVGMCLATLLVSGCGSSRKEGGIESIVNDFYEGNYEYELKRTTASEKGEEIVVVYEGKVIASPYEEYVKVKEMTGSDESMLWTECYYSKKGFLGGKLVMQTADQVAYQSFFKRDYPYGYGEKLEFVLEREEEVDGTECEVYKTEYTQKVGGGLRSKESLEAVITQEYYVDKEEQRLVMIYTDLEDLYRKNAIVNSMIGDEGLTLERAKKRAEGENHKASETLKIYNYNGKIEMTVLEP